MRRFLNSFRFAARGVALCLRERNFRFHLALGIYMYTYLLAYDWFVLSRAAWGVLAACTALVLAAEAFNTAIEIVVDLVSPARHPLAAKAKDAAAGAVLLCAAGAFAAGIVLLWQPAAFAALVSYYKTHPAMLGVLATSLAGAAAFVFAPKKQN
ncbi:MAG: diacylglycerol kinase family protein [Oscillospiraceae bacterium]|jgi:diacylglycerol kinase (ATP)|nr:diacylglycerol kinase family protein [Oscillospiraceae bacterium]